MELFRRLVAVTVLIAAMNLSAEVSVKITEKPPPKELDASIASVLQSKAIQLTDGDKPLMEIWLRKEIPLQSKMMSISDIFDALTASDRPYKRAVPVEKALDILGFEVRDGHVDGELVRIFREARPWDASPMPPRSSRY